MRIFFTAFALLALCCGTTGNPGEEQASSVLRMQKDTTIKIGKFEVLIITPSDSIKGDLLLLPGWNFKNTAWCDSTDVCSTALAKGLRVIAPQMSQSIYASQYYPETRADLAKHPTGTWLWDTMIPALQARNIFSAGKNYVLGLSTGGRGVALLLIHKPGLFDAAAALSGDFNQAVMPKDALSTLVYGPYSKFKERWKTVDNPWSDANKISTPLFLGHSYADKIVPYSQSLQFYMKLRTVPGKFLGSSEKLHFHKEDKLGHTWAYWRSELPAVWKFFESQ